MVSYLSDLLFATSSCLAGTISGSICQATGLLHQGVCSGQDLVSATGGCKRERGVRERDVICLVEAESSLDKRQQRINENT